MMKKVVISAASAAVLAASPAAAATQVTWSVSTTTGATPGHTSLCNFDAGGTTCMDRLSGTGEVFPSDVIGVGFIGNGTGFLNVQGGTAVLSLAGLNWTNLSFDWGTPDSYNSVILTFVSGATQVFDPQNIFGTPFPARDQNRRIAFNSSEVISSIGFTSLARSFEVDNVAGAVPEPGAWMLMILGLGAVGFAMRRRQNTAVRLQFA